METCPDYQQDRIKINELAWRHHFPTSLWEIFQTLKGTQLCREWSDQAEIGTGPRFDACPHYLQVWNRSDKKQQRWRHRFCHYKSIGAFCCHGNQGFDPICPKTLCSLSPTLMMLHITFDQDWPTGLRDIQVSSEKLWHNDGTTKCRKDKANPV